MEFWNERIEVNAKGDTVHSVDAKIINIGKTLLTHADFPVYCDAQDVSQDELQPWAKSGRRTFPVEVKDWIPEKARGRVRVNFLPPLTPSGTFRFHWGFRLPSTFRSGDDNWDISSPQYKIGGEIVFSSEWSIIYVRYSEPLNKIQSPPVINGNTIRWTVKFPRITERIRLEFGLCHITDNG